MLYVGMNSHIKKFAYQFEELNFEERMKLSLNVFEKWSNDQINNLNVSNPDLLSDDVELEVFNPMSVGLAINTGNSIALEIYIALERESLENEVGRIIDLPISNYVILSDDTENVLMYFEKLEFRDKIEVIGKLLTMMKTVKKVVALMPEDIELLIDEYLNIVA